MTMLVAYASKHGSTLGVAERIFFGALDHSHLSFAERMMAKAVRAPEGDFRDWKAIEAWAASIAQELDPHLSS